MQTMYPAQANSPGTELAMSIDSAQTTIPLVDASQVPAAPNLLTIGSDDSAETILYTGKSGNDLTGVTRGFQGVAQSWSLGTKVARLLTAYDIDAIRENITEVEGIADAAETPAGAQAKVDALAGVGNTKTVAEVSGEVADVTAQLADLTKLNNARLSRTLLRMFNVETTNIVCIGDSITAGDTGIGMAANPYPSVLQSRLRSVYKNASIITHNVGVNGEQITAGLARFDTDVLTKSPNCVVIGYGINDASGYASAIVDIATYKDCLKQMAKKALAVNSDVILLAPIPTFCFNVPQGGGWNDETNKRIMLYGIAALEVAEELNVASVDLFSYIYGMLQSKAIKLTDFYNTTDWTHPTETGYKLLGDIIAAMALDNVSIKLMSQDNINIPICSSQFVDTDEQHNVRNDAEVFNWHTSLASDGSLGDYVVFEFFNSVPDMQLYLYGPTFSQGGKLTVIDNGVNIITSDFYSPALLLDVPHFIADNLSVGYHKIEFLISNLAQGRSSVMPAYANFSYFGFEKKEKEAIKLLATSVVSYEKIIESTTVAKNVINQVGYSNLSAKLGLKSGKTMVFEAEGLFAEGHGLCWFNNISSSGDVHLAYAIVLSATKVDLFAFDTLLQSASVTINLGQPVQVRVEHTNAGQINIFINGTLTISVTNTTYVSGYCGTFTGASGDSRQSKIIKWNYAYI